jgi:hypothetical protein
VIGIGLRQARMAELQLAARAAIKATAWYAVLEDHAGECMGGRNGAAIGQRAAATGRALQGSHHAILALDAVIAMS